MRMQARTSGFLAALILAAAVAVPGGAAGTAINFSLVGSEPLYNRGMNAAPAVYEHWLYIGNRTDGQPHHVHPGVLIVDVADPAHPSIVGEIGPPDAGNISETSRELRVWPEKKLLIVMFFQCSEIIHACAGAQAARAHVIPTIKFFDLADPVHPRLVATYTGPQFPVTIRGNPTPVEFPVTPHEMFLWIDPVRAGRALLYYSTPTSSTVQPNLVVTDISKAREGQFADLVKWNGTTEFSQEIRNTYDVRLHSIGVAPNGAQTYLAYLGAGFLVLDTSELAHGVANPKVRLATPAANRVPALTDIGTHSAVKVPHRKLALTTDEVYGNALTPAFGEHGCPWGWVGIVDISDAAHPKRVGEFKLPENEESYCSSSPGQDPANTYFTSYASHNPTLVGDLALITWHSDGLRAVSVADATHPSQTGVFMPQPLSSVATEDPALSLGTAKVVAWSYPIIKDGLIYVVDLRNGLYVLRYTGPHANQVGAVKFLEGNSNLGDALGLDTAVLGSRRTHTARNPAPPPLPSTGVPDSALYGLGLLGLTSACAIALQLRRRSR